MPLTSNGKVDRRALPAPDQTRPELVTSYVAPSTEPERTIAGIWQRLLNIDQVGIHDNFFELGGHSLMVVAVHNQLQSAFSISFPVAMTFQYPTVSSLATYLTREKTDNTQSNGLRDRAQLQREALARQRELVKAKSRPNG